jgi:hypothetical protein
MAKLQTLSRREKGLALDMVLVLHGEFLGS